MSEPIKFVANAQFRCKVHGEVEEFIESTMDPEPEYVCQRCWWEAQVAQFGLMEVLDE